MVPTEKILDTALTEKVDVIGLSGLITPSLDEMVHVAKEMTRRKMTTPLLIGGATTSRTHTAVKIAPQYDGATVHVLDASRAVPVVGALLSAERRDDVIAEFRSQNDKVREDYLARSVTKDLLPLQDARARAMTINAAVPAPKNSDRVLYEDLDLQELRRFIDWTPFFQSWELKGRYPDIFDDATFGAEARSLFDDANQLLDEIIRDRSIRAQAVCQIFPAYRDGDDVVLPQHGKRLHFLRQQTIKAQGQPQFCLADMVHTEQDHVGAFVVTAGHGVDALCARYEAEHDDYRSILVKAVADRLAEAAAEWLHHQVRTNIWGYASDEGLSNADLIAEEYQGIRPAPGYPACPDHTEKRTLFDLLEAEATTGVELTESYAMMPAASVSGWYFAHPDAKYFGITRIGKDQVEDYARRKGMSIEECERWLAPYLGA
jgi:5-methyltetrahydrofolate--homocysteine methyltransferase